MRRWWIRRRRTWRRLALQCARQRGHTRQQLIGPVHGTIQTVRGMCTDSQAHEEIDRILAELDDLVFEVAEALRPTP